MNHWADPYLVSHIEENQEVLLLADGAELLPLLGSWVDTGWVMGTGVEDDASIVWDIVAEVVVATLGVEATGGRVVVSEGAQLVTGMGENGSVVAP